MHPRLKKLQHPVVVLVFLWVVLYMLGLGQAHLLSANEANRALAAREMLTSGDWVVPTLMDRPYLNKPPLYYWQAAACYMAFGVSERTARLPAALAALGTILAAYLFLARMGRPRAGFLAAVVVSATPLLIIQGTEAELDMGLILWVFLCELCMLAALWDRPLSRTVWAWVFLALATLTKGPPAWVFFLPMLVVQILYARQVADFPRRRLAAGHALGLLAFLALCLPWAVLVLDRFGWDHIREIIMRESLTRTVEASEINSEPFYFYLPRYVLGMLPWTPLFWLLRVHAARDVREALARRYLLACTLVQAVLFSLFAGKETQYLMPILPPLALLLGLALETHETGTVSRLPRWNAAGIWGALALCSVAAWVLALIGEPLGVENGAVLIGAVTLPLAVYGGRKQLWNQPRGAWMLPLFLVVFYALFMTFVRAPIRNDGQPVKAAMATALAAIPPETPLHVYNRGETRIYFYLMGRGRRVRDANALQPGDWVLYRDEMDEALGALSYEPHAEIPVGKKHTFHVIQIQPPE